MLIISVMPGLTRHPLGKAGRRQTLFDWTPGQARGDGCWLNGNGGARFCSAI